MATSAMTPGVAYPNGARLALVFQLMFEQWAGPFVESGWHLCPSISADEIRRGVQDLSTLSWQAYAGKAGFYRLLDTVQTRGIPASGVFSGIAAERYPDVVREFADCGHEIVAHGWSQEARSFRLDREAMRQDVRRSKDILLATTGQTPIGWMSPMSQPGEETAEVLVEEGFAYLLDYADDDSARVIAAGAHSIVSVPASFDVNDHQIYLRALNPPSAYVDTFKRTLDVLLDEGRRGTPRVMTAVFSGNLFGHPFGASAMRECIDYARGISDVWITTHRAHVDALLAVHRRTGGATASLPVGNGRPMR